jgi:hypothetical protein
MVVKFNVQRSAFNIQRSSQGAGSRLSSHFGKLGYTLPFSG